MKRELISILAANLFLAAPLAHAADEEGEWSGSATLGIRNVSDNANDPSKLNEYRDLGSGPRGVAGFELRRRSDVDYLNAYGENIGRDDQYLDLKGGRYGVFKYRLYDDELRHNFGSGPGARSPFSGIGTSTITATLPNPNVDTWNTFDHSYQRRNWGGMLELQATSPWYFRMDANEVTRRGVNVFGGANGTSPGNGFTDLPSPIDYTARNYSAEGGYSGSRGHFAVNLTHSTFENANDVLRWSNGFFLNGLDTTVLPPDNQLTRFSVNGNLRRLPADSTLAARLTYSKLSNDVLMQQTMLSTGGTNPATNPSDPSFRGDIKKTTLSLSLSSHPVTALDTKLYWNYAKEQNDSTAMSFNPAVGSGLRMGSTNPLVNCANVATVLCTPELFHYKKNNLGAEAGYRVSRGNKLSGGLDYTHVDRERVDFPKNDERKVFVEWKNSSLDALTGRIKYQYLTRRSHFDADEAALAANPIDLYVRRFDLANVNQNLVKLVLDATPLPLVDLGFEAIFKKNDYKDTRLGRTDDRRQEYYASVSYGDPKSFRVLLFGDIELVEFNSAHRVGTGNPDPDTAPTATTYNWSAKNKDKAWQAGIGADWVPLTRLTVKSSLIYAETKGSADFTVQPGGATGPFLSIPNFDNTRRTSLTLRAIYDYSKQWEFTGGYAYERYRYSDIGYDNTAYVTTTNNQAGLVTGQFSFQPYSANIVYGMVKLKF